jgi:hypothetical protein
VNYQRLNRELTTELQKHLHRAAVAQVRNQALVTQALAFCPNCHLSILALLVPIATKRPNLVQRIRRWLANPGVIQDRYYMPLMRPMLARWSQSELGLVMDRTDIKDRWSILTLAVAFRHRALPLAWQVLPFGATGAEQQIALLKQVQPYLPSTHQVHINFYGDAEFRAVDLQRYCQSQDWHWQVGLTRSTLFRQGASDWQELRTIPVPRGQRRYLQGILLSKGHSFGPLNLIADWTHKDDSPRYVATDQCADRHTWRRGRKRFWIEPLFRDWKSYGFDLERSQLVHPQRLRTLLLGMTTATLWMFHIGQWVVQTGRRSLLEAPHKHDYSLFRLGRDYAFRSQMFDWQLPIGFTVNCAR